MAESESQEITAITKTCLACGLELSGDVTNCPKDGTRLVQIKEEPLIGTTLSERYEVLEEAGRGGMSVVYKARHLLMNRMVALKTLHPHLASDADTLKRFQQEATAASELDHPNIISVYDFGVTPAGRPFLVLGYLEGVSLAGLLRESGRLPVERAVPIFTQVCDGLAHAHGKGIIHRDLKPSNIVLVEQDGRTDFVKIVDFGIAKLLPESGKQSQHLTKTGEVFGSPIYMSPEQCMAQRLDARSDIYALGCVMYETLTGKPPLLGESVLETMSKHVSEKPKAFRALRADLNVPQELEAVVLSCLDKDPSRRPQSMLELKDRIRQAVQEAERKQKAVEAVSHAGAKAYPGVVRRRPGRELKVNVVLVIVAAVVVAFLVAWLFASGWMGSLSRAPALWERYQTAAEDALRRGELGEAEKLAEKALSLAGGKTASGNRAAVSLSTKGAIELAKADFVGAQQDLGQAIDILSKASEPDRLALSKTLVALSELNRLTQQFDRAEHMCKRALSMARNVSGPDSVEAAGAAHELARVYQAQGQDEKAESLYKEVGAVYRRKLGGKHYLLADLNYDLGRLCERKRYPDKAAQLYEKALAIADKAYGADNLHTAQIAAALARVYGGQERFRDADRLARRAIEIQERRLPPGHPDLGISLGLLAQISDAEDDRAQAEELYKRALDIQHKMLPATDRDFVDTLDGYVRLLRKAGRKEDAERALSMYSANSERKGR